MNNQTQQQNDVQKTSSKKPRRSSPKPQGVSFDPGKDLHPFVQLGFVLAIVVGFFFHSFSLAIGTFVLSIVLAIIEKRKDFFSQYNPFKGKKE